MSPPVGPASPPSQSCPQHLQWETALEELGIHIYCLPLDTNKLFPWSRLLKTVMS